MEQPPLRPVDRFASWCFLLCGLVAVLYWSVRLASHDFAEPYQIAQVGHYAPWRSINPRRKVIAVGTDRRHNDIVLHDRKASARHLTLERRGGSDHWWAVLHNRSRDRRILIVRHKTGKRIHINQYAPRHNDRFLLPSPPTKTLRKIDWCSPPQVLESLRKANPPTSSSSHHIPFQILQHRFPLRLRNTRLQLSFGKDAKQRTLFLHEHQRIQLPNTIGGGALEYRKQRWQRLQKQTWTPLHHDLLWQTPTPHKLALVWKPTFSTKPSYQIGQANSPCSFPLRPSAIPGGLEIAGIARLFFRRGRLLLQHMGQHHTPLQILPSRGNPRILGSASLYHKDLLSLGQLTYRVSIDQRGVRLMLVRKPNARYLLPFFGSYPSHNYPMRRLLTHHPRLVLTGGGGNDPQADRWTLRTSLRGSPGKTQLTSPYRPFLLLTRQKDQRFTLKPLEDAIVYPAAKDGTLQNKAITKAFTLTADSQLIYTKRFYLRIFQPSYAGLARAIAALWTLVCSGWLFFLFSQAQKQRISLSPVPLDAVLQRALPPADPRRRLCSSLSLDPDTPYQRARSPLPLLWLWLPFLLLLPAALFLNGLGLYVLATLSLSSLGLNNNSFLYRQFLWSLVGISLYSILLLLPHQWWKQPLQWWKQRRPKQAIAPTKQSSTPPHTRRILGITLLIALLLLSIILRSFVLLPAGLFAAFCAWMLLQAFAQSRPYPLQRKSMRAFLLTLLLLGFVPLLGILVPPAVHNRFFLVIPALGTVKLSEFAILSALLFFAGYLGHELFSLRLIKARRDAIHKTKPSLAAVDTTQTPTSHEHIPPHERRKILLGALQISFLYLFLLGAIGLLYTVQGDLGPGLILTLCFSLYILFIFITPGVDRLVTSGNLLRIAVVFGGLLVLFWLPDLLSALFPQWSLQNAELQKVRERLALWNQPWRFVVGEQLLHNQWDLAAYRDAFQWFNNLHSDFVLTAVIRVLSPFWGYLLIVLSCAFPMMTLGAAWLQWYPLRPKQPHLPTFQDTPALLDFKRDASIRALLMIFASIYLFSQNFIHIGSTLRLTPMTGVTFTWISSGGTSLIACYCVLALIYRQIQHQPPPELSHEEVQP